MRRTSVMNLNPNAILPAVAAAIVLAGCGGEDPGNATDRAFAAEMVPHHESAVDMAEIALERGESPFVKRLAADIVRTQKAEIETLRREDAELADAGVQKGKLGVPGHMMGMDGDTAMLKTAEPFDAAFIEMMIPHHEGALVMAEAQLEKGSDPELQTLAREIMAAQKREIADMRKQADKG